MRASRGVLVGFAVALAVPAAAVARPPAKVTAAALKALRPGSTRGRVVVFAAPRPLNAGTRVTPVASNAATDGVHRLPVLRARRRAWLFWEDDDYGAEFVHHSTALLVDARTRHVSGRLVLGMPPVADGRPLPFDATPAGYHDARYVVWGRAPAPPVTRTAAAPRRAFPRDVSFDGDCLITIGDRYATGRKGPLAGKSILAGSFDAIEGWADSVRLPRDTATSAADLGSKVTEAVGNHCVDVFIFIAGHGLPPAGVRDESGHELRSGPPGILLDSVTAGAARSRESWLTPADLAAIVDRHPSIEFKFKIESCFSGRFADERLRDGTRLPDRRNVRVIETSSSATESSYAQIFDAVAPAGRSNRVKRFVKATHDNPNDAGEFTNGDVHGLELWASLVEEQLANPGLAGAIARSSALGKPYDAAQVRGYTHPVVVENPPLPGSGGGFGSGGGIANQPPVAAFTFSPDDPPNGPKAGQTVVFDGAGSSDPDGSIASWSWSFGGSGVQSSTEFPQPGIYPVTMTVTDGGGATAQVTHEVKVSGPGTKSDTATGDLCGADGFTDLYVPSFAQNVRIKVAESTCTSFSVGTQGLIAGNPSNILDEWGQPKDTYHVNWHTGGTGSGSVTITVEWD